MLAGSGAFMAPTVRVGPRAQQGGFAFDYTRYGPACARYATVDGRRSEAARRTWLTASRLRRRRVPRARRWDRGKRVATYRHRAADAVRTACPRRRSAPSPAAGGVP